MAFEPMANEEESIAQAPSTDAPTKRAWSPADERRFRAALLCYGAIAALAGGTLHGDARLVVLGVLALFAFKSWLFRLRTKIESEDSNLAERE